MDIGVARSPTARGEGWPVIAVGRATCNPALVVWSIAAAIKVTTARGQEWAPIGVRVTSSPALFFWSRPMEAAAIRGTTARGQEGAWRQMKKEKTRV